MGLHLPAWTATMANLDGLPPELRPLIGRFVADATGFMLALESGTLTTAEWRKVMAEALARYHMAAMMVGMGSTELTPELLQLVENTVDVQVSFLDNFARVINASPEFNPAWVSRAQMYAESPISSWSEGDMVKQTGRIWAVPAMPGQGTQCAGRCRCFLRYDVKDAEKGDGDIYWELGAITDNCQTCLQRRADWYPLKFRNGLLLP